MMDYRVPTYHGLLSKKFLDEQRLSTTYSAQSFARESMSCWTGNSRDSWFDSEQLIRCRSILKCEREAKPTADSFYMLSVDVGRYQANTAITVTKVFPKEEFFKVKVVYLEAINGENFITQQAPRIKKLIQLYKPREVVVDGNGLGSGLVDALSLPSVDQKTGEIFPAYYVFNDDRHLPPQMKSPSEEPMPAYNAIVYDLKANTSNDDKIHANFYNMISNNHVAFLAPERIIKNKLLATKKGQKMSLFDRRLFLLPYEMTSRLMDEINNLRLKPTGAQNQIKIEQISKTIFKDRFSSLEYNLWRVKYYEDKLLHKKKKKLDFKNMSFYTKRKG